MDWLEVFRYVVMVAIGLLGGKPLIDWIKEKLGWQDVWAAFLALMVSLVLGFVEVWLGGKYSWDTLNAETLGLAWTAVYGASQAWYSIFKKRS